MDGITLCLKAQFYSLGVFLDAALDAQAAGMLLSMGSNTLIL